MGQEASTQLAGRRPMRCWNAARARRWFACSASWRAWPRKAARLHVRAAPRGTAADVLAPIESSRSCGWRAVAQSCGWRAFSGRAERSGPRAAPPACIRSAARVPSDACAGAVRSVRGGQRPCSSFEVWSSIRIMTRLPNRRSMHGLHLVGECCTQPTPLCERTHVGLRASAVGCVNQK